MNCDVRPALSSAISDSRLASRTSMAARQSFSAGAAKAAGGLPVKDELSAAAGDKRWAKVSTQRPSPTGMRLTSGPCGYSMNHVNVSSTSFREEKGCRRSVRWRISPVLWGPHSSKTVRTARSLGRQGSFRRGISQTGREGLPQLLHR
jgi:hypothetical protein